MIAQVEFQFEGSSTTIQCTEGQKMADICKMFISKTKRNIEEVWTYSNFEKLKQKHGSKKVISYNIESTYSDGIEIVLKRD